MQNKSVLCLIDRQVSQLSYDHGQNNLGMIFVSHIGSRLSVALFATDKNGIVELKEIGQRVRGAGGRLVALAVGPLAADLTIVAAAK